MPNRVASRASESTGTRSSARGVDLRALAPHAQRLGPPPRYLRPVVNVLELRVVPTPRDAGGGFHVEIWIDGTELTASTAGLGMDAYDVLIPDVRLEASTEPRRVAVARCDCGVYGCAAADVTVQLDGDVVRWAWDDRMKHTFDVTQYRAELQRARTELSWETPERTAGRFVLERHDRTALAERGLRIDWLANAATERFEVALRAGHTHQVFVPVPWEGRTPEALATAVVALLREPPSTWTAEWHAIERGGGPPVIAGPTWTMRSLR